MSHHYHAVLWIDHHEARIIQFNLDTADEQVIHPAMPPRHVHGKAGSAPGTHITDEPEFYHNVATALAGIPEILLAGPSTAKTEFMKRVEKHEPELGKRVVGQQTMERMTDHQLAAAGRQFFAKADRMRAQRS